MTSTDTDDAKQAARERVWASLDQAGQALPPGAHGRIPNFCGRDTAARRLAGLPAWKSARVIKANPDKAQHPVRIAALEACKLLYMAVPRLATIEPFYCLDPAALAVPAADVTTGDGAARHAPRIGIENMQPVDLVICGTVAVSRSGTRVGKGAGYSDIEIALLTEAGLIGPQTVIATTVHDLQVIDAELPETEHDFRVDLIITPTQAIHCGPHPRPRGLYWDHLTPAKIAAIPALASRHERD
jgi:5-formyltetrahydrofolate cyclo-ligase